MGGFDPELHAWLLAPTTHAEAIAFTAMACASAVTISVFLVGCIYLATRLQPSPRRMPPRVREDSDRLSDGAPTSEDDQKPKDD